MVYADVTGHAFDVMFGPVAFSRAMLPFFVKCNPKESYGGNDTYIQHIAPMEAMAGGRRVVSVEIDMVYPLAQREEEEGALNDAMLAKRRQQMEECSANFRLAAAALKLR